MTITLDIRPEIEAELARQAAAKGRAIESYAAALLEKALYSPTASLPELGAQEKDKDMVELFAPLRGLNIDFERDRDAGRDIHL